ncbi:Hypothetical protein AA314_06036 [Archangium gephyra]|uniref:Uncharacterized protein n=1 Tax=Archangium gephyra TaxID=48 RepID=A0AAC8TG16_9BACT|nr:Hypothetical protein AA314_06036 [Archangium gephyra]
MNHRVAQGRGARAARGLARHGHFAREARPGQEPHGSGGHQPQEKTHPAAAQPPEGVCRCVEAQERAPCFPVSTGWSTLSRKSDLASSGFG